ncbi:universal stress protein [Nonomuraea turkmeniaca]|uniref:Universal stress protein n=1 Tax=Nonomuraea turkmeniaca TaxID=103838 RepID=A0A5S4FCB5_9ACTN|nr:universal stress protein [Nonomuraea turkmeniaca]TMR15672.1 universal stress protein [Nonomuraea turkmeniaca]
MTMPIVVGVDGSAPSLQAASWAGREAAIRGAPLRMLYAAARWAHDVPLVPQPPTWGTEAETAARDMLDHAAVHARAGRAHLSVTTDIVADRPADALVTAAEGAQLLVVGNRGRGGFTELLLGSVSLDVVARAPCPVTVVRQSPAGDRGEIVVGVTGKPGQDGLLNFAFREPALRRATLRAVHAWTHPATRWPGDMQPVVYDVEAVGEEEAVLLAEALAGWREEFPDVVLVQDVVHEQPARALIDASAEADLVVIGAHSGVPALLGIGSTAHAVLHHSRVPVVVVRP